ncbi:MAG TPA: nuclear transport factor 2 family protein [Thermoanaerobaculia bacterium]|jgi:ketosteroid isomerase-like protein|nr:nuclear transport factor 2 family protein [Thermoanaerobaculia bacterium]
MTLQNKDLIRVAFDELSNGNSRALLDLMADDVTWRVMGTTPWSRTYVGKTSVIYDLLRPLGAQLVDRYRASAERVLSDGEFVIVQAIGNATTKLGVPYNNEYCFVYRFEDGLIREVTEYLDTALLLNALGTSVHNPNG